MLRRRVDNTKPSGTRDAADSPPAWPARRDSLVYAGMVVFLLVLYKPTLLHFGHLWLTNEVYSYGVFVPAIVLYLLWRRWPALRGAPVRHDARGLPLFGAGLVVHIAGRELGVPELEGAISLIPVILGLLLYLRGRAVARLATFPVVYFACGLGLFDGLIQSGLPRLMRQVTARSATVLATMLGTPTTRAGFILTTGGHRFVVADECNGFQSLLALFVVGWLLISVGPGASWTKMFLGLSILPLVVVANVVRVALVLALSQHVNQAFAEGVTHSLFGVLIFAFTLGALLLLRNALLWLHRALAPSWLPRYSA